MSSFLALRQLLTVGDLFAASALIMALAWLAPFRKTASLRHLGWMAGFAALLLLPVLLIVVPSHFSFALAAPAPIAAPALEVSQNIAAPAVAEAAPQPTPFHVDMATLVRMLIAVWLLGVAAIALRGMVALIGLDRLRRNSVGHIFRDLPKFAQGYDIRIASDECGPVTWGFVRPIILLPQSADYWPTERVAAVLLHEIAHIRRRDSLTQMLSLIACAFYWPNPFVWIGARAMRREAEIAADDAVIVSGVRPSYYAAELMHLAAQFRTRQPALLNVSVNVPMAERAALEARVESILAQTQQRTGVTRMDVLKITATGVAAAAALAFACPSLAQDAPLPPPAMAAPADLPPPPPVPVMQAEVPVPTVPPVDAVAPVHHNIQHVHIDKDSDAAGGHDHRHIHFIIDGHRVDLDTDDYAALSPQKRAEFDRAEAEARAQVEKMRPQLDAMRAQASEAAEQMRVNEQEVRTQMDEARVQARIAEEEARTQAAEDAREAERAVHAEQPRIEYAVHVARPQIEAAIAEARAEIAKAHIDPKIQQKIDRALQRVVVRVDGHVRDIEDGDRHMIIEHMDAPDGDAQDIPPPPPSQP
jgi:beta-lactamase regulating signal transducer with metallopeptidase domain